MPARQHGRKERGGKRAQYTWLLISHAVPRESFFLACPSCAISPLHDVLVFHAISTCTFEPSSGYTSSQLRERPFPVPEPGSTILGVQLTISSKEPLETHSDEQASKVFDHFQCMAREFSTASGKRAPKVLLVQTW